MENIQNVSSVSIGLNTTGIIINIFSVIEKVLTARSTFLCRSEKKEHFSLQVNGRKHRACLVTINSIPELTWINSTK